MTQQKQNGKLIAIITMIFLFGMISFVTNLAAPMGIVLKNQFSVSNALGMLGNFGNFIAYAVMGIPSGILLQKVGYKKTALIAVAIGFIGVGVQFLSGHSSPEMAFAAYLIGAMIENELKENTELISVTAANCQTGTSEPFTGIGTMTSEKGVIFHTDAAFAFGKMPINVERSHIDMLTADASYFGGPENAGFLYVRKSTGAGEYVSETALSEETLTVMSDMAESLAAKATTFMEEFRPVRNHMCERIFAEIEDVELNGHKDHHLTNHLNIRIKNVSAAVVQKALKEEGIEAGIGTNSNILAAIGRSKAESAESVSFSLKAGTTMEDADKIVDSLKEIVTGERTVL